MAYKIFTKNNYFHIVDTVDGTDYEAFKKDALVRKKLATSNSYWFYGVNGFPDALEVAFADIQDENGAPYADIATWETWYSTNTGNFNSGGATPLLYKALFTQPSEDDPDVTILKNTTDLTITWSRTSAGTFEGTFPETLSGTVVIPAQGRTADGFIDRVIDLKYESGNFYVLVEFAEDGFLSNTLVTFEIYNI